jgi:hypothetical protein
LIRPSIGRGARIDDIAQDDNPRAASTANGSIAGHRATTTAATAQAIRASIANDKAD